MLHITLVEDRKYDYHVFLNAVSKYIGVYFSIWNNKFLKSKIQINNETETIIHCCYIKTILDLF